MIPRRSLPGPVRAARTLLLALLTAGCVSEEMPPVRAEVGTDTSAVPVPAPGASTWAGGAGAPDLSDVFGETPGTLVVLDARTGREARHDPERSRRRMSPFSTFKIVNSLIALENGVAPGTDFRMRWDSIRDPRETSFDDWYRDHDMRSAMRNSVVWYYRELARRTGTERMGAELARIGYGNADVSGGVDRFWLGSSLQVSAEEQVDFLRRFHSGELGFSPRTTRAVKDILVLEDTPEYRLSGKTGGGYVDGGALGWLVGYVERGGEVYFFAINVDGKDFSSIADRRHAVARAALRRLGVLPGE